MKDPVQLFIDQRGTILRALLTESGRVLARAIVPGPLDNVSALQDLVAELTSKSGRKPELAHLLIAGEQVKFSTYHLQEMPLADVEKIVQRSLTTATGEKDPIFRLTPLATHQEKEVYLAEQIPRVTVTRLTQLFADAKLRLVSISTTLQANLVSFAPHRDSILQAQAIFDISPESVTAIFISPTEILHQETVAIQENERESDHGDDPDSARAVKRRLFAILNVIHGLYSQHMMANPLSPVEKVWLCGPGAEIVGLEDSLIDAMDLEVAPLDLLAGQIEESRAFTPLAGLIHACQQRGYVNFISGEINKSSVASNRTRKLLLGGVVLLALVAVAITASLQLRKLEKRLAAERAELQVLQTAAAVDQGRAASLRYLQQLNAHVPPLYNIIKEVADGLPVEIQLDAFTLLQGDEAANVEILAVTSHRTPWENERIFTSLMTALGGVQRLACQQNPDIAMLLVGKEKLIKLKVQCQILFPQGEQRR